MIPALLNPDRRFMLATYQRIVASMDKLSVELVLIHGDAGPHNVFITPAGARYSDFEDVSLGPREWDVGWLGGNHLKAFEPINRDLLLILSDLRSLCVAVWCFAKSDMPDKA
jgi:aminoglycoside phosphotransferase (APT) family kinase protein